MCSHPPGFRVSAPARTDKRRSNEKAPCACACHIGVPRVMAERINQHRREMRSPKRSMEL